jgi:hypothetical protein
MPYVPKKRFVTRDPFAREELHATLQPHGTECHFCGNKEHRVYRYEVQKDGLMNRTFEDKHCFCSQSCRRCYYN